MSTTPSPAPMSPVRLWSGRVISALPVAGLIMSGVMKLAKPPEFVEGFQKFGYPAEIGTGIGIVELICTLLYVIPQTSVLGAILLTGYLGGAVATHVRIGESPSEYAAPIIMGVLLWLGLLLRDRRLQALLPIRRPGA